MANRPSIPARVARALRQEAAFGCARCGHPYIEYHHIIPWALEEHYRVEDMVALCGNCHPLASKQPEETQRGYKAKAFNRERGLVKGALISNQETLTFRIGGELFHNVPTLMQYQAMPLVACRLVDGRISVAMNLLNEKMELVLSVVDNEIALRADDFWDFRYGHNWASVHSGPRQLELRLDFRESVASLEGRFWAGPYLVEAKRDVTVIDGGLVTGCSISNVKIGIMFD